MPSAAPPIRVAINDDYVIVVRGVAALLAPYDDRIAVVELDANKPTVGDVDVILYDSFGHDRGADIDIEALSADGRPRVAVYTWDVQPELIQGALEAGAAGYLWKGMPVDELVDALEQVHAGNIVTPPAAASPDSETGAWPGRDFGLSAREAEIVALITQGMGNQEIADKLYLSINSVKTYIRTAYRKIGVQRRAQAVAWGMTHGFEPDHQRSLKGPPPPSG